MPNFSNISGKNAFGGRKQLAQRQSVEQSVLELARERIATTFERFDTVSISFSGGKDSTVVLMLALEEARRLGRTPLDVVFFDEEAIPYQTAEYVRRVADWPDINLRWYCLPVKHRNACSRQHPWWYPWAPEDEDKWVRPLPPEAIQTLPGFDHLTPENRISIPDLCSLLYDPGQYGSVAMMLGIRGQESLYRMRAVLKKKYDNYFVWDRGAKSKGHLCKVYPIYDWLTEDVWTAPQRMGWDYNRAYDVLESLGIPQHMQRCSPAFGEEPLQKLWTYQQAFPELWDRMCMRVPGVNTAAKYALTELYSYGGVRPNKPDDQTWEEYLMHYVQKFDPKNRAIVARNLKKYMSEHYKKTSDPILDDVKHPRTGVSWKYLLTIAMRGDFKRRKRPQLLDGDAFAKREAEYLAALAIYRQKQAEKIGITPTAPALTSAPGYVTRSAAAEAAVTPATRVAKSKAAKAG